ncbi:MAG: hypothetical protein J6B48_04050 [Clostridia bacterium]|nr:hypothetical protein [Clostridia bacterium]
MKTTKITKALVLALSLVLLVGSAIGISVAAEATATDSTAEISAQSIVHDDKIQIAFAIDATEDEVKAGTAYIEYYFDGDSANTKKAALYTAAAYQGKAILVTEGLAAQDLTSVVTATSYLNGAAVDTKTYSVVQFLLTKLYRDIDTVDAKYAALYESLIDYSAKAQAVFDPEETSINDYYIVWTEDAKYDGETAMVYNAPASLDLSKASANSVANYTFKDKWNVTVDGTATSYAVDATLEVSANTVISPLLEIDYGMGKYFNDTAYHAGNLVLDFDDETDMENLYYDYKDGQTMDAERIANGENEYVINSSGTTNWQGFQIKSPDSTTKYSSGTYVFEADFTLSEANDRKSFEFAYLGFLEAGATAASNADMFEMGTIFMNEDGTKYAMFGATSYNTDFPVLDLGIRYNIRIEHDISTGINRCYINGDLINTYTANTTKSANSSGVTTDYGKENSNLGDFMFIFKRARNATLDNIFYGVINGVVAE